MAQAVTSYPRREKSTNVRPIPTSQKMAQLGFSIAGRIAPELTTRLAERLFFTPQRHRRPDREAAWLSGARKTMRQIGEHRVAFYAWGVGRPVLLVHGWSGRGSQMGGLGTALAAAGFQAIAFDAPGHGDSGGRTSMLPLFLDCIRAAEADVGPLAAVVGHSLGAAATVLALADGLQAEKAVLISPPSVLEQVVGKFSDMLGLPEGVEQRFRRVMEKRFGKEVWERYSPAWHAPKLAHPALIIHDDGDTEIPASASYQLWQAWPVADFVKTSGLGHRRILRDPSIVARITQFVNEISTTDLEDSHA